MTGSEPIIYTPMSYDNRKKQPFNKCGLNVRVAAPPANRHDDFLNVEQPTTAVATDREAQSLANS